MVVNIITQKNKSFTGFQNVQAFADGCQMAFSRIPISHTGIADQYDTMNKGVIRIQFLWLSVKNELGLFFSGKGSGVTAVLIIAGIQYKSCKKKSR